MERSRELTAREEHVTSPWRVSTLMPCSPERPAFDDSLGGLGRMTSSEHPFGSVIVVTKAAVSTHQACIAAVLSNTGDPNFELLVHDEGTDAARTAWRGSMVDQHHHASVFHVQVDAEGCRGPQMNRGIAAAEGQIVV